MHTFSTYQSARSIYDPGGAGGGGGWGAGTEVWNRVYMIAPVKKFARVRLSTNFP